MILIFFFFNIKKIVISDPSKKGQNILEAGKLSYCLKTFHSRLILELYNYQTIIFEGHSKMRLCNEQYHKDKGSLFHGENFLVFYQPYVSHKKSSDFSLVKSVTLIFLWETNFIWPSTAAN